MSDASNYLETSIVNHFFRNSAVSAPATVYVKLFTAVSDAEAGTGTEATFTGYSPSAVTFGAPTNGVTSNSASVSWSASSGPETLTHFGVFDGTGTGANALTIIKALTASKVVNNGDTATFAASALTLTVA